MAHSITQTMQIMSKEESREMMAVWPDIVRDITNAIDENIEDVAKWMEKVSHYWLKYYTIVNAGREN